MIATTNNLHLTYCTNIHPGETWGEVAENLKQYLPSLKACLSPDQPFGVGLRLADLAARELLTGDNLIQLQNWLDQHDLYVFTLNGFPYGGFHHRVVKDKVYAPDWSTSERLDYTSRLIEILSALLPPDLDGGISTLPISYKPWWHSERERNHILHRGCINLDNAIAQMAAVYRDTGKLIHLDLEPEPDGMLENTQEVIDFFQNWLLPIASEWLTSDRGIEPSVAEAWIIRHIQVCYDTCHFAVEYEEPDEILRRLQAAGIGVGKVQLSSAIKIDIPADIEQRQLILKRLTPFAESTYLHQVITRHDGGTLEHYRDLSEALKHFVTTEAKEWRTHFHVPIFIDRYELFKSTQDHIVKLLQMLPQESTTHHLEIETYTWEVLPPAMKLDLATSIEREYQWVLSVLNEQ